MHCFPNICPGFWRVDLPGYQMTMLLVIMTTGHEKSVWQSLC